MSDYERYYMEQKEDAAYAADMTDAGYDDAWAGIDPRADDPDYMKGYGEGLRERLDRDVVDPINYLR